MADETYDFEDGTAQGWSVPTIADITTGVSASAALGSSSYGMGISRDADTASDVLITKSLVTTYSDIYVRLKFKMAAAGNFGLSGYVLSLAESNEYNRQLEITYDVGSTLASDITLTEDRGSNSVVLSPDTEYEIEMRYVRHATTGGVQLWLDGTLEIDDLTHDTSAGSDLGYMILAQEISEGTGLAGSYTYFDDVEIASTRIGGGGGGGGSAVPIIVQMH
jgi:hypothetical protein